ncbi:MAG: LacI family DNA-binding transcriptional regulator [Anaerolineales bacterium]
MPTLEEIAELSGVSRSTVSRVINDDPHVSERTRARVMTIVRELNYQPNAIARGLAGGKTQVLGLVIPTGISNLFADPYFSILIQGVAGVCNEENYSVMLWLAEPDFERRTIGKVLNNGLIDGILVSSALLDDPIVAALQSSGLPFVMVGRHPHAPDLHYVDVDNVTSAQEAVTHLLRLGHRRVATITGPLNTISGVDRQRGYVQALRSRGIPVDSELVVEGDFTDEGGYYAMQRLIPRRPEAIFVASDTMALGGLRALREAQLQAPEDVALVSFDDMPYAARANPPLTTMRQPIEGLGMTAARMLIDLIHHPDSGPHRVILPTQLVIRASCGTDLK